MIHGIGCDIVQISRLQNKQESLANRILSEREKKLYTSLTGRRQIEYLAGRFAGKEAIFKALQDKQLTISNIEILQDENGCPTCVYEGYQIHISISHEKEYAIAYSLCERKMDV